jgi:flagellar assembly protein FliH
MTALQKFMFETRFDNVAERNGARTRQAPKPPVTMTEEQVTAVREESFAAGRAEGAAEAKGAAETLAAQSLARIEEQLRETAAQIATAVDGIKRDAVAAAITTVRKLVPRLSKDGDLADIEAVVSSCLGAVLEEPRVVVRVHDSLLDPVKERIAEVAAKAGYDGKIVLVADDNFSPGDCRVEWADGGAERDTGWMWKQIDGVVERFFAGLTVAPPGRAPADETTQPAQPDTPGPAPDATQ